MDKEGPRMARKVNIGILGAGYWGTKLIREYLALSKKTDNIKLCAIADISKERILRVKEEFNIPDKMLYRDYKEVLKNDKINAVHISLPNELHYEAAINSLEAGKDILLEKPMALKSREAFKIARKAEKIGSILLVGHIFRFNNAINKSKQLIREGLIGDIKILELRWTTWMNKLPERDIIFDLAPHPIDIINTLTEEWPSRIYAIAKSYYRKEPNREETAFIIGELQDNITTKITLSWIHPGPKIRGVYIIGDKGMLTIDALNQKIKHYTPEGKTQEIKVQKNNTIESMIQHFIDRIINHSPPINSPLIGAITVLVLEKIRKSIKEEMPIEIII